MNVGWLLDFGYLRRWLPEAFRQESHTAIDRAAAEQRGDQAKNNSQSALAAHPQSLIAPLDRQRPKRRQPARQRVRYAQRWSTITFPSFGRAPLGTSSTAP